MLVLFVEKKAIKQQETKKYNAGGEASLPLGLMCQIINGKSSRVDNFIFPVSQQADGEKTYGA